MHTKSSWILVAAVSCLVASAAAQNTATIGKQVPDVRMRLGRQSEDEIYVFRDLRGTVAVFYFWRPTSLGSVELLDRIRQLHERYASQGVRFCSASPTADVDGAEEILEEKGMHGVFRWSFYGNGPSFALGAFSEPYVVMIDPRSILFWRGVPDQRLEERLQDLIEFSNPPAGDNEWKERQFRAAERHFDRRELGRAYTRALALYNATDQSDAMHGRAESLLDRCEQAGHEWLREAVQAETNKDFEKAARIVSALSVRFEERDPEITPEGSRNRGSSRDNRDDEDSARRQAEIEIGRMNANRELKQMIREARENAEGELLNDRALILEEDEYHVMARELYERVLEEYEDTNAAQEARKAIERIKSDRQIQKKIAERRGAEEAVRWLSIGDSFASFHANEQARDYYQRIIKEHPDSRAAERARQRLADLPKAG